MQFTSTGYSRSKYAPGGARRKKTAYTKKVNKKAKPIIKSLRSVVNSKYIHTELINNQLNVYQYPFSTATKYPKIPDGKEDFTIGLPFQFSQSIRLTENNNAIFILFPGMTDCCTVYSTEDGYNITNPTNTVTHVSNAHMIQHVLPFLHNIENFTLDYSKTGYTKYRYVSLGLRIGVDSAYLNNGGFWEAVRIPFQENPGSFFNVDLFDHGPMFNHITPSQKLLDIATNTKAFHQNPTYQSGSLKQLGNYEFRLFDNCMEHDFVHIPRVVELSTTPPVDPNDGDATMGVGDAEAGTKSWDNSKENHKWKHLCDNQHDIIIVKIYGPDPVDNKDFSFAYHTSANVEMVCDEVGSFSHFATGTYDASSKLRSKQRVMERAHRLPGVFNANKRFINKS